VGMRLIVSQCAQTMCGESVMHRLLGQAV